MEENVSSHAGGSIFNGLNRLSPQAVFALVAGFFGIALSFITPPMQIPDEPHHWYRVYQLGEGKLLATNYYGGEIPASLLTYQSNPGFVQTGFVAIPTNPTGKTSIDEILNDLKVPLEPKIVRPVAFPNTALYTLLPYAPQTLTMLIARLMNSTALGLLYAGRVGTVLGYVFVGWAAIRITPILKWSACMILTGPMALFLAGSVSADPMTTAMAFLATAVALRCIFSPGPLSSGSIAALGVVMLAVTLCKSAYFPLAFLVLVVPRDKWGRGGKSHRRWAIPTVIILLSIGAVVGWSMLARAGQVKERGDGPQLQLHWILHHPLEYAKVMRLSLTSYWPMICDSAVGNLGWMDTSLLPGVIDFIFFSLVWVTLAYDQPLKLGLWPRAVAVLVVMLSTGFIFTANYMVWNPVGYPVIEGLQGRYFLPIGLVICMVFRRSGTYQVQAKWMLAMLSCLALYTCWVVVERYYLPPGALWKLLSGSQS